MEPHRDSMRSSYLFLEPTLVKNVTYFQVIKINNGLLDLIKDVVMKYYFQERCGLFSCVGFGIDFSSTKNGMDLDPSVNQIGQQELFLTKVYSFKYSSGP